MADVIDEVDGQEVGELEVVAAQDEAKPAEPAPAAPPEDDVPPEFRGKSAAELARIAQHARREMGRQANELGEVRKLADELLKSSMKKPEERPKEVDFFENPQEAIRLAVENNPRVLAAEQYAVQARREQTKQQFYSKHPDAAEIVQRDPDFAQWVQASKVRTHLFKAADNFDLDAADELLSTYKELRDAKTHRRASETTEVDTKARDAALKSASVETGGSGETTRKIFRRADLIRLKMSNPSKYESMQDEIMQAYQEGRVK